MTTTATAEIASGFSIIVINLDEVASGFEVNAVRFYRAGRGGAYVEGTLTRKFTDRDKARTYANGYYARMIKKGWTRVA